MDELKIQSGESTKLFSSHQRDEDLSEKDYSDSLQKEKYGLYTLFKYEVVWTINKESKVSYVNPFVENCIGMDAEYVIKNLVSTFLSPVSVISCLIELEELKLIVKSESRIEPRKIFLETLLLDGKQKKIEITNTALHDSMNNYIGFMGSCHEVSEYGNNKA